MLNNLALQNYDIVNNLCPSEQHVLTFYLL